MGFEAAMARAESAHLAPGNPALDSWSQHRMLVLVLSLFQWVFRQVHWVSSSTKPIFPNSSLT